MGKVVNMKTREELNQYSINKFDVVVLTAFVFSAILNIGLSLKDHDLLCAGLFLLVLIDGCGLCKIYHNVAEDSRLYRWGG